MQRLVSLDQAGDVDRFLQRARWSGADGIELDLTAVDEEGYQRLRNELERTPVNSLHYGRTDTVALTEQDLFTHQIDVVVERAQELGAEVVSIHPPYVEIETSNTVRDVQHFLKDVNAYAADLPVELCLTVTGFLTHPKLVNTAFDLVDEPHIGVMVDLGALQDGVDPAPILDQLSVDIRKLRMPLSLEEMEAELERFPDGIVAVAATIE